MGLFSEVQLDSIRWAVSDEIEAGKKRARAIWLDIDAIKFVREVPGGHVYNLLLSKPIHLSADQPLIFHLRGGVTIESTVISSSDEGLVVCCSTPLPEDAVVMNVEFDPSFIVRRLGQFIEEQADQRCPLAESVVRQELAPPHKCDPAPTPTDLNSDQRMAVAQMGADPIHFLWGPPGTGKTTTLGAAIADWAGQGKTVLVVSTSNAAVDVAMRTILARLKGTSLFHLLHRLGKSDDPEVSNLTKTELSTARVVGCTTAKMVLDSDLRSRRFDVVVVDEASMVSLLYAIAAGTLTSSRLVYGGDPMQLPPICQSESSNAQQWFGTNVYDWLDISLEADHEKLPVTLLRTQYRMTERIGDLVSHLCYRDRLSHGRGVRGAPVEFIDVPKEWRDTFLSVPERSYYHPFSIPVIHSLVGALAGGDTKEFLMLTPFRPQQSLLGALAFDLRERFPEHRFASSTIHRSQGGERRVVILDLTTHSSSKLVKFFEGDRSERLLNVGLSRAKDHLVVIGNQEVVLTLAVGNVFWERLLDKWDDMSVCGAEEILDGPQPFDAIHDVMKQERVKGLPSICSYRSGPASLNQWTALLAAVEAPRKLLVMPSKEPVSGGFIVREDDDSPPLFVGQGHVCLPMNGGWVLTKSPNVGRVIWRVGFSHLAEEEVQPTVAEKVFQCPMCAPGKLVLRVIQKELRLACHNELHRCFYNRRLSLKEAAMKVRLSGWTCCQTHKHPMTAREGPTGIFMSCENWPDCQCPTVPIKILEGT